MPLRPIPCAPPSASMRSPSSCTGSRGWDCRPLPAAWSAGTTNIFGRERPTSLCVLVAPHAGWRHVRMTARRTALDYARCLRWLVEEAFPLAERIALVQDNLNTHTLAALYAAFPPAQARAIASRLEVHYTPKHGSWLNMAEIEISVIVWSAAASRVQSPITTRWFSASPPWRPSATQLTPASAGNSPPMMLVPSCMRSILTLKSNWTEY